ncbi:MAG: MFS transporter [Nitrososphaeria archaeon]
MLFLLSLLSQMPLSLIRFYAPIFAVKIGATGLILGLMGFSYGVVYTFSAYIIGKKSEKIGYIRSLEFGLIFYALIILLYVFVKIPYLLILIRGLEALSMSLVWPSLEALSKFFDNKKASTAMYTIGWSFASTIAPYLGSLFTLILVLPFIIASAFSLLGGILAIYLEPLKYEETNVISKIDLGKEIIFPIFFYGFSVSIIYAFYSAYAGIVFGVKGSGMIMSISSVFIVMAFLSAPLFKDEPKIGITLGLGLQVFYVILFVYKEFFLQLVSLSLIFYGSGIIYFYVLYKIMFTEIKGLGIRTGTFESSIGAGYTLGPLIGGLASFYGFDYIWLVAFIAAIVFLFFWVLIKFLPLKRA